MLNIVIANNLSNAAKNGLGLHINLVVPCSGTRLTVNFCLKRATIIRVEDVGGLHCMEFRGVNIVFSFSDVLVS